MKKNRIIIIVIFSFCDILFCTSNAVVLVKGCPPIECPEMCTSKHADSLKNHYSSMSNEIGQNLEGIALDLRQVDLQKYKNISNEYLTFINNLIYCDNVWMEKKVRSVYIIALNGSINAFNYIQQIITKVLILCRDSVAFIV